MRRGIGQRIAVVSVAMLAVAGCTRTVDGAVWPAPGLPPHPLSGNKVTQVPLDGVELEKMFNQPFEGDPEFPPRFGDDAFGGAPGFSPADCAVVVGPTQRSGYASADVQDAVHTSWWAPEGNGEAEVIEVEQSVVALPTADNADALFEELSRQWDHCGGIAVSAEDDTHTLSGSKVANSVLSAESVFSDDTVTVLGLRAAAVRVNCVVEVEVSFYSELPAGRMDSAVAIARAMMQRVTDLS